MAYQERDFFRLSDTTVETVTSTLVEKLCKGECPNEAVWYWTNTMDRVWNDDFDQPEMIAHHSVTDSEEECVRTHVDEPVSITHFILNDFEDGIIFTFKEIENIEIQVLFSNELPVSKITGNVEFKDSSEKTSIISLNDGDVRYRSKWVIGSIWKISVMGKPN